MYTCILFYLIHGSVLIRCGDFMSHGSSKISNNSSALQALNSTLNSTLVKVSGGKAQTEAQVGNTANDKGDDKSVFMLGILISFCVVAVLGVVMTIVCWVKVFSQPKKPKENTEFKTKDAENLDKRNMRDVQLTEYAKRKQQMRELDNQQDVPEENGEADSEDDDDLDEITAVQSQPLEEETIVNPNFIHHYIPRKSSH